MLPAKQIKQNLKKRSLYSIKAALIRLVGAQKLTSANVHSDHPKCSGKSPAKPFSFLSLVIHKICGKLLLKRFKLSLTFFNWVSLVSAVCEPSAILGNLSTSAVLALFTTKTNKLWSNKSLVLITAT